MATLYWDLENGVDAPGGGTGVDDPLLTWAQIKTELGGVPTAGDEIRILGSQLDGSQSPGGGNAVYTKDQGYIEVPTDLENPGDFVDGLGLIGPDGRLYIVKSQSIVANGRIAIYGRYVGETESEDVSDTGAGYVRVVTPVDAAGRVIGTDAFSGSSGNPALITGGWYDSGGGTPAQETVNGRTVPTLLLTNDEDNDFWAPSSAVSYVTFRDIAFGLPLSGTPGGHTVSLGNAPESDNVTLQNCHAYGLHALLETKDADSFLLNECAAHGMYGLLSTGNLLNLGSTDADHTIDGLTISNCRGQDAGLAAINYLDRLPAIDYDLKVTDCVVTDNGYGSQTFGVVSVIGGNFRGFEWENIRGVGCGGVAFVPEAILMPRSSSSVENRIADIDLYDIESFFIGGFGIVVFQGSEKLRIDNVQVDMAEGEAGAVVLSLDPSRCRGPVPIVNLQIAQRLLTSDATISWSGVGDAMLIDCSIDDPLIDTDILLFNIVALGTTLQRDSESRLRFIYTDGVTALPGAEKQIVAAYDETTELYQMAGYVEPDPSTKLSLDHSARIEQYSTDDDAAVYFDIPLGAGQRAVTAMIRKNSAGGGYAAYGSSNPPGIEVTYFTWDDGALTEHTVSDYISDVDDTWEGVTVEVEPDHDQVIRVKFANRSKVATSLCWIDNLLAA